MHSFRVLATSAGFEPGFRWGGPARSLVSIVDTVSDMTELCLVARDRDLGAPDPYPIRSGRWLPRRGSRVFYLDTHRVGHWLRLWRELSPVHFDLLYVNSLWDPIFTIIPIVAVRLGILHARNLLIAPRGELTPGALSIKNKKKRLFLKWWKPF